MASAAELAQQAGARRQQAMDRLSALADSRSRLIQREEERASKKELAAQRYEMMNQEEGVKSAFGAGASGAMAGTAFGGPGIGTAVGAGAGLLLGGIGEAQNRRALAKAQGKKDPGFWSSVGDTFGRAPSMGELQSILGAAGGIGGMAAQQKAMRGQQADMRDLGDTGLRGGPNGRLQRPSLNTPDKMQELAASDRQYDTNSRALADIKKRHADPFDLEDEYLYTTSTPQR